MLGFGIDMQFPNIKKLTVEEDDAIHAYVIDGSWKAYNQQQKTSGEKKGNRTFVLEPGSVNQRNCGFPPIAPLLSNS